MEQTLASPEQVERKSHKLSRGTVNLIRLLMEAGGKKHLFENLCYDPDHPDIKVAVLLATMVRIKGDDSFGMDAFQFRPIAIGWWFKKIERKHFGFDFHEQFQTYGRNFPNTSDMLDQLQPDLPETYVTVLETKRTEKGEHQIEKLSRYKTPKGDPKAFTQYLLDNNIAVGLGHALKVAEEVIIHPSPCIDDATCLWGENALGKSLFILTAHNTFAELKDKEGTPRVSWLELQIASAEKRVQDRCIVRLHSNLNIVIPVGSLIALSGITWLKDPEPRSEY